MCVPKSSLDKITLRSDDKKCQNPSEVCCPDDMEEDSMVTPEPVSIKKKQPTHIVCS